MIRKIWNIYGTMSLLLLALTACHNDVADLPDVPAETMRLLVSVPENIETRAPGDPGSSVDEAEDWDRMDVILAYDETEDAVFPNNSKVMVIHLSQDEFNSLPAYDGSTTIKELEVKVQRGELYLYGVIYKDGVHGSPADDITRCRTRCEVEQLTISNYYAMQTDADGNPFAETENVPTFLSVGTGYYQTAESNGLPAAFSLYASEGGLQTSYPVVRITRLATKIDVQWDAADAYEQGYSDVRITDFTYHGEERGRLFPMIARDPDYYTPTELARTFYNTTPISQRNGRVYHYSFSDGMTNPRITFQISAEKDGAVVPSQEYSMNFDAPLKQATWYKVNVTVKGLTGSGNITLGSDQTGTLNLRP